MIALLQRVRHGSVHIEEVCVAQIERGLLVLVGVERHDDLPQAERLLQRLLNYRVFEDDNERMNRSLRDIAGGLLLVPQFTLCADTRKGNRPSFQPAATPERGKRLFEALVQSACQQHPHVASGRFGANMQVSLCNDGPVTFWLQTPPPNPEASPA